MNFSIVSQILFEADKFRSAMTEPREKGKEYTRKLSAKAMKEVEDELRKDLEKSYTIDSLELKLGKFRGFQFISSCKLSIKPKKSEFKKDSDVDELVKYLKDNYSPKFRLNSILDGVANLNIR